MRVAVHVVSFTLPGGTPSMAGVLADVGRAADDAGIHTLSFMDHYFQLPTLGGADEPMLEGYTALGFLAAHTTRADLQLLVTGVTYRHPGLLAKIVTTLDVLSGGRAVLGLGAAWYEREHLALGVPFPPPRERLDRLEETLQIVRQMWSADDGPYEGRYYQLAETVCRPRPLRAPRPPIMVGGGGERRTLRLVARYADACNLFAGPGSEPLAEVRHKLEVLREHCEREGRAYDDVRKTLAYRGRFTPTADEGARLADELAPYAELGVTDVHLMPPADPVSYVRGLGEHVVPRLAPL
jgi:F420-dependent oxidoreductase-like protein